MIGFKPLNADWRNLRPIYKPYNSKKNAGGVCLQRLFRQIDCSGTKLARSPKRYSVSQLFRLCLTARPTYSGSQ